MNRLRLFTKNKPYFEITSAYSMRDCSYIGDPKMAKRLWKRYGIEHFEIAHSSHKVCSIGFSPRSQQWYGWSHRAIHGFGIGSIVGKDSCCTISGWTTDYLREHPEANKSLPVGFEAKTLEDAKRMAIAFAEAVS